MRLIFGIHCHQPLGNFGWVIDEACEAAYLPFVEVMRRHPDLPFNVHYSGCLLEWVEDHRPDLIEALQGLGDQAEWMTGGFYEPIFPIIPHRDRIAQIEMLTDYVRDRFGQDPKGLWLTERVWDPGLPTSLVEAGVEYLPIDDFHFLAAGYRALEGSYVTDHLGATVRLFPISQRLRYTIPFEKPEVTIRELRQLHERNPDGLAVMADDGEKFGVWPGTSEWMYGENGWLERFLRAVEQESDWLTLTTFERYMKDTPPSARVAIPPGSYYEMTEWALPAETGLAFEKVVAELEENELLEEARPFVRGGYWPGFQVKYPESNAMYRKMLRVSNDLADTPKASPRALTELLRSQCNCSYWHGVFGGLYLAHIRADVHQRLIGARSLIDRARHRGGRWAEVDRLDWDADGEEEVHVELPEQSWVVDPGEGGTLLYRDDKPARWSVTDVVARRFEAYHPSLVRPKSIVAGERASIHELDVTDPGLEFVYDPHPRRWLVDHLLPLDTRPSKLMEATTEEIMDLPSLRYDLSGTATGRGSATVVLRASRDGAELEKTVRGRRRRTEVRYRLKGFPEGRFGPEVPVSVWEGAGKLQADDDWHELEEPIALDGDRFTFLHEGRKTIVTLSLRPGGVLYAFPLRTISKSEAGYDEIMQGVVLWPHWRVEGTADVRLRLEVGDA